MFKGKLRATILYMHTTSKTPEPNQTCAQCGAAFRCGSVGNDAQCWCFNLPHLPTSAEALSSSCLCPQCFQKRLDTANHQGIDSPR